MVFNFVSVGLVLGLIWLALLTYLIWRMVSHYNNLTKGVTEQTLSEILEHLLKQVEKVEQETHELKKKYVTIEKDGTGHVQKIGLLRFNPFKDTGGDQSFILSLVDGQNSGVVISSLYSRSGTRWYAKKINMGKGADHELSEEEKKALKVAVEKK